jgi:hypothetical protein
LELVLVGAQQDSERVRLHPFHHSQKDLANCNAVNSSRITLATKPPSQPCGAVTHLRLNR